MDDFHHGVPSSPSIKSSPIFNDVDENEPNYQQKGANLQNIKKSMAKNYMSPTISAASKEIAPKKKILAERNEVSESSLFDTNVKKFSVLDNSDECLPEGEPVSPELSQSNGDDDQDVLVAADFSSQPYDPLTNYLSPRPRFLRYKPNRRLQILRGRENETGELKDGLISRNGSSDSLEAIDEETASHTNCSYSVSSSSSSVPGGGSLMQEDETIEGTNEEGYEESDDEEEEEEVEGCKLKRAFKSFLLLAVLVLSAMFISSMNSSTPSSASPCCCKMKNSTSETSLLKNLESGNLFSHQREERQKGLTEVNRGAFVEGIEEGNVLAAIMVSKHESAVDPVNQEGETQMYLMEEQNIAIDEGTEEESFEELKRFDELEEAENLESGQTDAAEDDNMVKLENFGELVVVEPRIEDEEEVFSQVVGYSEDLGLEPAEKIEVSQDYQTPFFSKEHDEGSYASSVFEKTNAVVVNPVEEVHNEDASDLGNSTTVTDANEVFMSENLKEMKTEFVYKVLTGVLISSAIVTSLLQGFRLKKKKRFHLKKKKSISIEKNSPLTAKPCPETLQVEQEKLIRKDSTSLLPKPNSYLVEEKYRSELPSRGNDEQTDQVYSAGKNPPSSVNSIEKAFEEEYVRTRAPVVEFLGEFVVSEVRSAGIKNRTIESEDSNHSVSSERIFGGKTRSVSVEAHSEFSAMDSHLHESYTSEQKTTKKEDGGDGEANLVTTPTPVRRSRKNGEDKVATTPVRRSSRIRNRALLSP